MPDVARFGTLLIPNRTGNSQLEYPIEKTSVLIGRCVIDPEWDPSPEKIRAVVPAVRPVEIDSNACSPAHPLTLSRHSLPQGQGVRYQDRQQGGVSPAP